MRTNMLKEEIGRIKKGNVKIVEYGDGAFNYSDKFFVQVGVIGMYCTKQELNDLYDVLNYYHNIEGISNCEVIIEGQSE